MSDDILPCATCHGDCCGPIPLTSRNLREINAYVAKMPQEERERLGAQKRDVLDCGFLDMESHRCSIYPVRPQLCQIFGLTATMQCPHTSQLVTIITNKAANIRMKRDRELGPRMVSTDWEWV